MTTVETIYFRGVALAVLVKVDDDSKATCTYFIDGNEIADWGRIKPVFQDLLTALADEICRNYKATKWIY